VISSLELEGPLTTLAAGFGHERGVVTPTLPVGRKSQSLRFCLIENPKRKKGASVYQSLRLGIENSKAFGTVNLLKDNAGC